MNRTATAILLAWTLLACSEGEHPAARPASDHWVAPTERASLLAAANEGDWRAARRLGLFRFFELEGAESYGSETERLYRVWAAGEAEGTVPLAHLLAMRCSAEDRREAVQLIEAAIEQNLTIPSDPGLTMLRSNLLEYRDGLDEEDPMGCVSP
jgi:hypothetical protein